MTEQCSRCLGSGTIRIPALLNGRRRWVDRPCPRCQDYGIAWPHDPEERCCKEFATNLEKFWRTTGPRLTHCPFCGQQRPPA